MQYSEFLIFKKQAESKLSSRTAKDKIKVFVNWCNKRNIEEIILRLSSEGKWSFSESCKLDFTTKRLIIKKNELMKKFIDTGFVAGLAPYPYLLTNKELKTKIRMDSYINLSYFDDKIKEIVWYDDIEQIVMKKGIDNIITNMMGRMIVSNYLFLKTKNQSYRFELPVNKNGTFDQILYWLDAVLPFKVLSE